MAKEIFFVVDDSTWTGRVFHTWTETQKAIKYGLDTIVTTQMGLLHPKLFDLGYKVYVYESAWDWYEIKLGDDNEGTKREIRRGHNLFKMWQYGEFLTKDGYFYDH